MRYRILGTTQALRPDGTALPVGGARLRALLTVFALRPGRTVPAGVLVEEVWNGDAPADAPAALQALVGRLRRVLGPDTIASAEGGYRLCAVPDDVDLHRFARLAEEGTRALADDDPAKAAVVLDDALGLWQGPALADLPDRTAEAARWETRRLDTRRARLTAALALGAAEQSLPELTALCDSHPLDEPLQALRLRALRDAGRPAQALAAYDDVRRLLADRLGADPGPELRSLHAELLRPGGTGNDARDTAAAAFGSAAVDPTAAFGPAGTNPAGAAPAHGGAPAGRTPRPSVSADASRTPPPASPAPPPSTPPPPPGNLRARLTSFVGREADIEAIRGDLAGARLVTLLGPGGAGKTRLSQEAAEAVRDGTADPAPDGVWLAELAPVVDPDAVPEAVLTALGARETVLRGAGAEELRVASAERHDDPLVRLTEHCANRRMLILLDNCEHVVDAAAHLVAELLARCPGITVLATSREPLGVPGELVRPVEPLPEPVALRLLADRGAAARPGFRVEDDPEAAAEICGRLDGLPLAIELAAARLRLLSLRQIADRLDDRFRLLTSGSRTVLPRQQTLRAVVDWSWDLLDTDERDVLRRLSVFAGGCDLAAAEAVCGPVAFEALASLVDKSLVVAAPSDDSDVMRYRLLETVAEYAGERLDESGARPEAERAHLTHYRELARTTDPLLRGPGQLAALDVFQRESENIRAALRHAVTTRDEQEALCLVLSISWYWQMRDLRLAGRNWSREVMTLGPDPFTLPARPAQPVWERCTDTPPPWHGELLEEARRGVHLVHLASMDLELEVWQTAEARQKLRAITEVYEPGTPQTCRYPGLLWFYAVMLTRDMERLSVIVGESVRTCREAQPAYEWELAACLQMRANVLANRSDWAGDATRDADESLEIFRRLGDAWGAAEALSARGEARERRAEYDSAAIDFRDAMELAEQLGARAQKTVLAARLGNVFLEAGRTEEGEQLLRDVIEKAEGMVNEALPAARLFLAAWLGVTDRVSESREQLRLLRAEFRAASFVVFDAFILGAESWLDVAEGHYEEAIDKARQAVSRADDELSRAIAPHLRSTLLATGAAALVGFDPARAHDAARCLGAADALLPPGHVSGLAEREIRSRAADAVRDVLGGAAYGTAYDEGTRLSAGEATALI
ncbi:AfsR/SARP family transcriptional regulator [Streptomyces sp. WI04-05B]|uniref:AfsR/SARP family transcriptional regulator n=1 Tax=Streptomyces TaxID=1883 RepID=UPI0029A91EF7|nr:MULTISPECIES: BTAD domain-containing putative transcriptional regulator [unclassified Streptomyces]MDX2545289.1 BTAD domain-containing putative transcriptional regulator [Streptomyces sp. WI04-05B]MDX2588216.1 BTAD domain-containing putative transcriptional regulator [Streptomyces sp. WI04-05A]